MPGHGEVRESSRGAVGQLWKPMAIVFQEEAMRMQMRMDQAVYNAVHDIKNHIQGVQEEVRAKLSKL